MVHLTDRQIVIALDRISYGDPFGAVAKDCGVSRDVLRNEIEAYKKREEECMIVVR